MTAVLLLAAAVSVAGGPGVPESVQQRARVVVEAVLDGADGEVRLEIYRTAAEMEAAVQRVDPAARAGDFAAYYHYGSRTVFAWMAPHCDDRLFADRLPGPLLGALTHEAQHALAGQGDRSVPAWRAEGVADRDAVKFLAATDWPGRGAWEWMLESRVWRARTEGLFAPDEKFREMTPLALPAAQRAVWYAQAYEVARGERETRLPWILWQGSADPAGEGFRIYPRTRLVRSKEGPLDLRVTPIIPGDFEIRFGGDGGRIRLLEAGGVQAGWPTPDGEWEWDRVHPCPPLHASSRIRFDGRVVSVDGTTVLYVQLRKGRVGIATGGGAFDVKDAS